MNKTEFKEVQHFRVWWAWLGVASLNCLFVYAIIQQLILGKPFGSKPAPDHILIIIEMIALGLLLGLFSVRLITTINAKGISYRFYPFQFSTTVIEWHELKDAYMREYSSLYEFGGWGIRYGSKKTGRAINTSQSGKIGLQLKFSDGSLLLIGTTRPDEIKMIIDKVMAEGKINRGV